MLSMSAVGMCSTSMLDEAVSAHLQNDCASVTTALPASTRDQTIRFTVPPTSSIAPFPWLVAKKFHIIVSNLYSF